MLMRKSPSIRLNQCINPSTSSACSSSWEEGPSSSSLPTTALSSIDNIMSPKTIIRNLKERSRMNAYQRIEEEYSLTDSTTVSTTDGTATTSSSNGGGSGGCAKAKMSITQQGYYSPFEQPKPVNDYVIAPNAFAEPMACLASTSVNSASPTRNSFFERIRDVFRPRSGSKTSTSSDNQQTVTALNSNGIIEDLGEEWINIMYHEYSEKVGKTYKSSATELSITGFCDLSNNFRFNLGSIAKPNRTPLIRSVRDNIRDGVKFYNRNGDVYVDCLSNVPIFVQAPLYAHSNGNHLATVYKVEPGHSLRVFSARNFDHLIFMAQRRGPEAIAALQQICCIRVSFQKGWGESYHSQTVLETPAWIEVLFVGALKELDMLIMEIKANLRHHLQIQQEIDDIFTPSMSLS